MPGVTASARLQTVIPALAHEQLRQEADKLGMTVSGLVRLVVINHLRSLSQRQGGA